MLSVVMILAWRWSQQNSDPHWMIRVFKGARLHVYEKSFELLDQRKPMHRSHRYGYVVVYYGEYIFNARKASKPGFRDQHHQLWSTASCIPTWLCSCEKRKTDENAIKENFCQVDRNVTFDDWMLWTNKAHSGGLINSVAFIKRSGRKYFRDPTGDKSEVHS